jgi:hypothetical protein
MIAGDPGQGGASWAVLQYFAGLAELGHDVLLVEPLAPPRDGKDPLGSAGATARYFSSLPLIEGHAALLAPGSERTLGLAYAELQRFAAEADLLVNVSGMLRDERLLEPVPVRLFLDLDPGFNQVWEASGEKMGFGLHTHFATVGQGVGRSGNPIPDCGREWLHTLPPVALSHWPQADEPPARDAFTSIGHWRSYGSLEHGGIHYGQRAHSLRQLIELPRQSPASFQLALGIHPDEKRDLEALAANGWELVDPAAVAADPAAYAEFVRASKAEISIAKSGYVASRSGWVSDRSAVYLASGRPVVAQDTGFGDALPRGEGLLTFSTAEQAAAAVAEIEADFGRHRRAAREIAEAHLDARKVLPHLLDRLR